MTNVNGGNINGAAILISHDGKKPDKTSDHQVEAPILISTP